MAPENIVAMLTNAEGQRVIMANKFDPHMTPEEKAKFNAFMVWWVGGIKSIVSNPLLLILLLGWIYTNFVIPKGLGYEIGFFGFLFYGLFASWKH